MRSKEQILTDKGSPDEYERILDVSPYYKALEAMDEYARQEALGFAEWMKENCIDCGNGYCLTDDLSNSVVLGVSSDSKYSVTELYSLYTESKTK